MRNNCFAYLQKLFLNTHAICNVDVDKDQPKEKIEGYLLRACYSRGVSHSPHCGGDSKAGKGVGKLYSGAGRGALGVPAGGLLAKEAGSRPAGEHLCDWLGEHIWFSLVGPNL